MRGTKPILKESKAAAVTSLIELATKAVSLIRHTLLNVEFLRHLPIV